MLWLLFDMFRLFRVRRMLLAIEKQNIDKLRKYADAGIGIRKWLKKFSRKEETDSDKAKRAGTSVGKKVGKLMLLRRFTPAGLATVVATGDVLESNSDTGSSTAGDFLAGGIAVAINLTGTVSTQNNLLVQLKTAIEHSNGHDGKITVSSVPSVDNGAQSITLTQSNTGYDSNRVIENNLVKLTSTNFDKSQYFVFMLTNFLFFRETFINSPGFTE